MGIGLRKGKEDVQPPRKQRCKYGAKHPWHAKGGQLLEKQDPGQRASEPGMPKDLAKEDEQTSAPTILAKGWETMSLSSDLNRPSD